MRRKSRYLLHEPHLPRHSKLHLEKPVIFREALLASRNLCRAAPTTQPPTWTPTFSPTMPTYYVVARYRGLRHTQAYHPAEYGRRHPGYATSFSQLRAKVEQRFGVFPGTLKFYTDVHRSCPLRSTMELNAKLARLPRNGRLTVHCGRSHAHDYPHRPPVHMQPQDHTLMLLKRFARHRVVCHHTHETPLNGIIYEYIHDRRYVLCRRSYERLSRADRAMYRKRALPRTWAPDAPYALCNSDDVRHLQYLLTRLGFMRASDTDRQAGRYGSLTKAGVERFRVHYGIFGGNPVAYDRRTAKKLAHIVRAYRCKGHRYI